MGYEVEVTGGNKSSTMKVKLFEYWLLIVPWIVIVKFPALAKLVE